MKKKSIPLGLTFVPHSLRPPTARATTENSVVLAGEPDISDCDGRYGFTRSWEWIRQIPVPENWSGAPVPVTLSVTADDSATLTMGGLSVSASYSGGPGEDETTGALKPGYYQARMSFTNIDYEPPEGNVAVLSWSISAGVSGTLVPEENPKPIREADCTCGDDDSGGTRPAVSRSRAASASSSSSAGRNTRLETKESHVRWRTDFGKFRGMGGVPAGALEITAHEFSSASATPAALEFSHPFNSWLVLPPSGVAANAQLKLFCGGSCTSWMCDGNGETFFPLGASSGETSALRWNADKSAIEQVFPDKSVLAFSAGTGEIVSFKTRHGNAFSAAELSAYVDVVRDADGVLLQVRNLWDGLANVENVSETGYEIALYLPNQIGEKSAETGRYAVSGTPFKKFVVAYSPETGKLSITERDMRAGARAFPRALWFENGAWCTSVGAGAEEIVTRRSRTALTETTYRLVTEVAFAGSSVPASRVAEIYEIHPVLGDVLASRTEGYGTDSARTTHYLYDSAGRLIRETRPDGSVVESGYDDFGRLSARYEPHVGARNRTTLYRYVSADSNDPDLSWTQTSLSTTAGPVVLSRTDYVYAEEAEYRRVEKRTSGLGAEGVRLEVEETWRGDCGNVHARGRVKMTQNVLGVQTHYAYAATSAHGALYSVCAETRIAGEPVNGKSTREVRFVSAEGNTTRSEKYALDEAGTWRLIASVDFEYDAQNRETKRTRGNGRVSSREMMCCGPLWETDEDGVRTDYVYDSAQRLTEETRALTATTPERTRLYERDAAGRVTRETLKLNSVDFSEKTATWDLLGRLVSETDELGRATSYAYAEDASSCTTTETVTLPSGATRVTKTHADGTVLLEAGTSRRGVETLVDFVSDGMRRTRRLAGTTEDSGILFRRITNGFGEEIRTGTPNTLGGFIYLRKTYDARGLLVRSATDGLAPELYEYDAFGDETKRTLALAENPSASNSRIRETETFYETREDGVYRVSSEKTYAASGAAITTETAFLVSESATLESKTVSKDARGNASARWTEFGEPGVRLSKTQMPGVTNIAQSTTNDGFTVSQVDHAGTQTTFARNYYAGENARIELTTTDGRGNATLVVQNVLGWTTKTVDAAGNSTTTAYDLAHGKPSCVTDALGKTHRFAYDLRGNVAAEFGTGVQPAAFAYDDADNLVSQKLFRASSETIETDPRSRADGDETAWTYHAATGLLLSKTYPDASGIGYAYDAHNRLSSTTFSREVSAGTRLKVSRAYAELTGELVSVSYNDGTAGETHTYNHLGQVTRTVDASGTRAYVYNRYNEVESETLTGDGIAHAVTELRDAFGRGTGYAYAKAGTLQQTTGVSYAETTGRIATASFVHGGAQKTFSYAYLAGTSLVQTLTCPNNMTETRSYEAARNLLSGIAYKRGTTLVSQRTYVRDALGRPLTRSTSRNGTTQNDTFGYNARSELTSATLGNDEYAYAFDNIGNRNTASETGAALAYSTNNLNQYASIGENEENAFVPGYDADGNATSIQTSTGTWTIACNGANRPVRFRNEESDTTIECGYDSQGRRCFKKVTVAGTVTLHHRYIYRGYLQIACVDLTRSGHPALWFVLWDPTQPTATRPLAIQKDGTWYTYGCDITKNVCEVFGPAGYIRTSYSYAPFGAVSASGDVTQPFQWSSEHYDSETALVYYNFRHYSPDLGRFLSRDPIEEQGGWNLYAFVKNNPNLFVEYRGGLAMVLIPIAIIGIVAIGVISVITITQPKPEPLPVPEIPEIPLPSVGEATTALCACILACIAKGLSVAQDVADTCKRADPGDCTKEQHAELQKAVNETKGEKRCLPSDTCATLYTKETTWSKQAIARQIINNTCYRGGDKGHKQALEQAQINVRNCATIIARKCMA